MALGAAVGKSTSRGGGSVLLFAWQQAEGRCVSSVLASVRKSTSMPGTFSGEGLLHRLNLFLLLTEIAELKLATYFCC